MDISLLLVHDDPSVMRGVRMRLEVEGGFVVLGDLRREEAVAAIPLHPVADVIVLDADVPGRNLPDLATIRALASGHPVVVLTLADSDAAAVAAIEAGAAAVVRKHDPSTLIAAIRWAATPAEGGGPMT